MSEEKSQIPPYCHILYKEILTDCNGCFLGCNTEEEMCANHTLSAIVEFGEMMGILTELVPSMYTPKNKQKLDTLMKNIASKLKMIALNTLIDAPEQDRPDEGVD
jgi:hypothetical protein